jgi:hypothetical protein
MPVSFTDAELDILMSLSACIEPPFRDAFLRDVAGALAQYPEQARGPGLVHREASKLQRYYAHNGPRSTARGVTSQNN